MDENPRRPNSKHAVLSWFTQTGPGVKQVSCPQRGIKSKSFEQIGEETPGKKVVQTRAFFPSEENPKGVPNLTPKEAGALIQLTPQFAPIIKGEPETLALKFRAWEPLCLKGQNPERWSQTLNFDLMRP